MHPAASIIAFTTVSGMGYGLAAALGIGLLDPAAILTKVAHLLALAMIAAGLLSSTLHLGNPQRAWRAFSQWRSSWLSREGVLAVAALLPLGLSAWLCLFEDRYMPLPGLLGAALGASTVYCTAMIYASLRSVQAWNTPLTPLCYLCFSAAGGGLLASCFAGSTSAFASIAPATLVALAWSAKVAWWRRADIMSPLSTPETATGLGPLGKVRLLERPHVNENYLTREMGYRVARKHARKLRLLAIVAGGIAPAVILVMLALAGSGTIVSAGAAVATVLFVAGLVVERWLFFAEAKHAVMTYYGG